MHASPTGRHLAGGPQSRPQSWHWPVCTPRSGQAGLHCFILAANDDYQQRMLPLLQVLHRLPCRLQNSYTLLSLASRIGAGLHTHAGPYQQTLCIAAAGTAPTSQVSDDAASHTNPRGLCTTAVHGATVLRHSMAPSHPKRSAQRPLMLRRWPSGHTWHLSSTGAVGIAAPPAFSGHSCCDGGLLATLALVAARALVLAGAVGVATPPAFSRHGGAGLGARAVHELLGFCAGLTGGLVARPLPAELFRVRVSACT
jgi:hypothetical protein